MVKMADNQGMGMLIIILFILLVGPAALLWGADSRDDSRGFFGRRDG